MEKKLFKNEYETFVGEIKTKVYEARHEALRQANKYLIKLYWEIGKGILDRQEKYGWGKSVVEQLSKDLQTEFPGLEGFSSRNLWRMRMFCVEYEIVPPVVAEIGWSHNVVIMEKCKDHREKEFYIEMTRKYGWTKNVLIHHIEGRSYQQYLKGQTNFDKALPEKYRNQAKLAVKDEYNLEFLELTEQHNEKELELAILKNVRNFLSEMGGDFAFIGNQFKLEVGNENYYVDIPDGPEVRRPKARH